MPVLTMLGPVYMDWAPDKYTASAANTGDDQMVPWHTDDLSS